MKKLLAALFLFAAISYAQPAYQTGGKCQSGTASCATGNMSVTAGQYILAGCGSTTNGTNVITVTDSASNTYTQLSGSPFKATSGPASKAWFGVWTATAGTTTATLVVTCHVTQTANWMSGIVGIYSTGGNGLAVTNCENEAQDVIQPASFTAPNNYTATANQLIIGLWGLQAGNAVYTAGSGFTARQTAGFNTGGLSSWGFLEDKSVSSTGTYAADMSFTDSVGVHENGNQMTLTLTNAGSCTAPVGKHHSVISQ